MAPSLDALPVPSASTILLVVVLLLAVYTTARVIYNVYFHPLAKFPGPKLAAISRLPAVYWLCSGTIHTQTKKLHDRYGDVVRIEPNMLAYRSAQGWKDICGHRKQGAGSFIKDPDFYISGPLGPSLINANDADHARERRLLAHAFSETALRKQEQIVQSYVDLLLDGLKKEIAASRDTVDLVKWYNFTTFDIIGDLAFGEPFDCLRDTQYHPWVAIIFQSIKAVTFLRCIRLYPMIAAVLQWMIPKEMLRKREDNMRLTKEKAHRRLETKTDRPDFMSYILRYNDERGMTIKEIEANSSVLIIAGSETTASLLSGCTFYLLKNPRVLRRLVDEVRGTFSRTEDMTFLNVAKLPYLNAVLQESLRIYPPVAGVLPRRVPEGGAMINGKFVPEGTTVSMAYFSAFHSESNFTDAESFVPERWLDDADPKYDSDIKEALQPFSFGPRNCLGKNLAWAEMRLIMTKMLWSFELSLQPESTNWADQKSYVIWEKKPLMVKLTPVEH